MTLEFRVSAEVREARGVVREQDAGGGQENGEDFEDVPAESKEKNIVFELTRAAEDDSLRGEKQLHPETYKGEFARVAEVEARGGEEEGAEVHRLAEEEGIGRATA